MVTIKHLQSKESREISRRVWETNKDYIKSRASWEVIDGGDPVTICQIEDNGENKELYLLDRDHAERMIKQNPTVYRYQEISESHLKPVEYNNTPFIQDELQGHYMQYYAVGAKYGKDDQSDRFISEGIWESGWEDDSYENVINNIHHGDILFLKSSYATKDKESILRIKAIGAVSVNPINGKKLLVQWHIKFDNPIDIKGLGSYRSTIEKIRNEEDLNLILSEVGKDEFREIFFPSSSPKEYYIAQKSIFYSETDKVLLGVDQVAEIFTDIIVNSSNSQKGKISQEDRFYGIFGQWGRGKTHFWNLIKNRIHHQYKDKYITLEFHAWKYQDTPSIWAYLYETFANEYYHKFETLLHPWGSIKVSFQSFWLSIFRDTYWIWLFLIGVLTFIIFLILNLSGLYYFIPGVSIAVGAIKSFSKPTIAVTKDFIRKNSPRNNFRMHLGIQHEVQKELKILFKAWNYGRKPKTFILFIDDIDRCSEDKIVSIVDSIRVLLNDSEIQKRLIVLAAIDERILCEAIRKKYCQFIDSSSSGLNPEQLSAEYIDKLFIAGIKLPQLTTQQKAEILRGYTVNITDYSMNSTDIDHKKPGINSNNISEINNEMNTLNSGMLDNKKVPLERKLSNQLHPTEENLLITNVELLKSATPRNIRGLTIKYRLAKTLIELNKPHSETKEFLEWHYSNTNVREALIIGLIQSINLEAIDISNFNISDNMLNQILNAIDMVTYHRKSDLSKN